MNANLKRVAGSLESAIGAKQSKAGTSQQQCGICECTMMIARVPVAVAFEAVMLFVGGLDAGVQSNT